jgi:hypothetical protein
MGRQGRREAGTAVSRNRDGEKQGLPSVETDRERSRDCRQ